MYRRYIQDTIEGSRLSRNGTLTTGLVFLILFFLFCSYHIVTLENKLLIFLPPDNGVEMIFLMMRYRVLNIPIKLMLLNYLARVAFTRQEKKRCWVISIVIKYRIFLRNSRLRKVDPNYVLFLTNSPKYTRNATLYFLSDWW